MIAAIDRLSPRQRECLQLVWEKQAQSKEIALELGIAKATVDGYIREAVELLGARDRREAARIAFGPRPHAERGDAPAGVPEAADPAPLIVPSTEAPPAAPSWPDPRRQRNTLASGQTLLAIVVTAFVSLAALALVISIARGMGGLVYPVLAAFDRLTR